MRRLTTSCRCSTAVRCSRRSRPKIASHWIPPPCCRSVRDTSTTSTSTMCPGVVVWISSRPPTHCSTSVTKGYKAGSFPMLSASTSYQYLPVKQESVLDYEGGFKVSLFDGKLQLNGGGF